MFVPIKREAMPQIETNNVRVTLKVHEAAEIAGCGDRAIRNMIAAGKIPSIRFGRNVVIPRSAFLRWLDAAGEKA
jgi:excisionase family DNA binding protein